MWIALHILYLPLVVHLFLASLGSGMNHNVGVYVGASCLRCTYVFSFKVVGAKVVTNARSPGARCYGFVTMSTAEEATKCINHLHKTELHGKMISVEKVRGHFLPGM